MRAVAGGFDRLTSLLGVHSRGPQHCFGQELAYLYGRCPCSASAAVMQRSHKQKAWCVCARVRAWQACAQAGQACERIAGTEGCSQAQAPCPDRALGICCALPEAGSSGSCLPKCLELPTTHPHRHLCVHPHLRTHTGIRVSRPLRCTQDFDAEGLGNLIWSIAALQCVIPERDWFRQFVGSCNAKMRSFQATQLVQLVESLAVLGWVVVWIGARQGGLLGVWAPAAPSCAPSRPGSWVCVCSMLAVGSPVHAHATCLPTCLPAYLPRSLPACLPRSLLPSPSPLAQLWRFSAQLSAPSCVMFFRPSWQLLCVMPRYTPRDELCMSVHLGCCCWCVCVRACAAQVHAPR